MTLQEFTKQFETTEACLEHLEQVRWEGKPFCPHSLRQ